jgi:hypothetical protein
MYISCDHAICSFSPHLAVLKVHPKHRHRHGVTSLKDVKYKKIWAWVLSGAKEYAASFDYDHTQGAVIFVRVRQPMGPRPESGR